MGLYSGGLIIGRIFASGIWGAYFLGGLFWGAYYRNFTVFCFKVAHNCIEQFRTLVVITQLCITNDDNMASFERLISANRLPRQRENPPTTFFILDLDAHE